MKRPESRGPEGYSFHYNREEREAFLDDEVRNRLRLNFWGRNRHLLLIFIDILVVSLVFMFLLPYLKGGSQVSGGYRFSLGVANFDGTALISLKAEGREGAENAPVVVSFIVLPDGRKTTVYDVLSPEEQNIVRGRLPLKSGDERIRAEIDFAGETLGLEGTIPKE